MSKKYDFLIVGAGLFGCTVAYLLNYFGYKVLVIDKNEHIGGNIYDEYIYGINVHKRGPHIFHTNLKNVWDFVNMFTEFNDFINSPIANYKGEIYSLPFNMYTFNKMFGVVFPNEAEERMSAREIIQNPKNLEEQAISMVGFEIYEKLIKGYTEKQWGRSCKELPSSIIKRLPLRFTYDNNYFNDRYQGIPVNGYTSMLKNMLKDIDVRLNIDYMLHNEEYKNIAYNIIYTGRIDRYFDYKEGVLDYRCLRFDTQILPNIYNFQGNAVVNYTDSETKFTRIIEHKWFNKGKCDINFNGTIITREFPYECLHTKEMLEKEEDMCYPINDERNTDIYEKYKLLSLKEENVFFGGRLGLYQYNNMDTTILKAFGLFVLLIEKGIIYRR